ncbi:MAG: energy-coupling factor transporter ATPase [Bacilli bacterium]|nr:energy-coupling factor transporter ATPase [Bacilli bacterium]
MAIEVKNVSYTYSPKSANAYEALTNVSITINDGDYLTIVGQTGSGKSTLVQMLNGLEMPTLGEIFVDGVSTQLLCKKNKTTKELRKKVGLVFQFPEYQLFEETIVKDVAFGLINNGMDKEQAYEKAKEYILKVGLNESYFNRSPFELSGGERRKVAIAGILALEPKTLVLDEPTAGLDPRSKKEILEFIKSLHEEGRTVILVTHNMEIVRKYANHVVLIDGGKIFFDGTPDEFFLDEGVCKIIEIPEVISFARSLAKKGIDIDINRVRDVKTLINQIEEWRSKHE